MKTTILVVGRNAQIMETVLRLINGQQNWEAVGALVDDDALNSFSKHPTDIVLIGGGINEDSEKELSSAFKKINPVVKIVRHYGGGSGLLFNEILQALQNPSQEEDKNQS